MEEKAQYTPLASYIVSVFSVVLVSAAVRF